MWKFVCVIVFLVAAVQAEEGKAFVKSDPTGATVSLVEFVTVGESKKIKLTELGKTPCLVKLPMGKVQLDVTLDGFDSQEVIVEVVDAKILKPDVVALKPMKKQEFNIDVVFEDGWSVSVDGKKQVDKDGKDVTTPATVPLTTGKHALTLSKSGFKDIVKQLDVAKADTLELKDKPEKAKQAATQNTIVSSSATYSCSSLWKNSKPLPTFLTNQENNEEYAFITDIGGFVTIDLQRGCWLTGFEIVNRKNSFQERAGSLMVSVSDNAKGPWKEIWRADAAKAKWNVELEKPTAARFIKLSLANKDYLHLYSMKLIGR